MLDLNFDRKHLWHPYTSMHHPLPVYPVVSANGVRIKLENGQELIDGTASWWCVIHGYNHPVLNDAAKGQLNRMSHVMFGGLTHQPAIALGKKLVEITPEPLQRLFFADSGSVAVEVAIKTALQYQQARKQTQRNRLLAVRGAYHGDTAGAMSVSDPVTGMHSLFNGVLPQHIFAERPRCRFDEQWNETYLADVKQKMYENRNRIAAVIIEPIVQGAGGMHFYSPVYLKRLRDLCNENEVLLILDEIATGFGRTGTLFAMEHAGIVPDILCIGKALTGGYMTLSAMMTTDEVAETISSSDVPNLMHGPTFMANPLACAVAGASLDLLLQECYNGIGWRNSVLRIERILKEELTAAAAFTNVADVRVLGAIGVIEMKESVHVASFQERCVQHGIWVRPFGKLVYVMPPYIIGEDDLRYLTKTLLKIIA